MTHGIIPLEDELGDILDKAISLARICPDLAASLAKVDPTRLRDALDWRSELTCEELSRLAAVLNLNEVGLCALAKNAYPLPEICGLPFCLYPLRMPHGIGVVNAYIVSECGSDHGILFDTGPSLEALNAAWPPNIKHIDAVFLTHTEAEHAGGLCEVVHHFKISTALIPEASHAPCGQPISDGGRWNSPHMVVTALLTPGHAAAHNCYLVESTRCCKGKSLLISGDLLFAASVGCAFYCQKRLRQSLDRILSTLPPSAIVAPGHGPLTTMETERRYNPFIK